VSNSVRNVLAGLGVFFVCIATFPAVFASTAETGSQRLGYGIGVLLVVVGVPVLARYIYVRVRGDERP
jgi:Na+/melibiose symporter-like transporter